MDLPAARPLMLSVGGSSLRADRTTGAYQAGATDAAAGRGVPDVAADASPATGMVVAFYQDGRQVIGPADGTSASTPFWAGIIAFADQFAGRHLGPVNPAIYRIARSNSYHRAFHDITTGGNTVTYPGGTVTGYRAAAGWDPVTGWGTPTPRFSSRCSPPADVR